MDTLLRERDGKEEIWYSAEYFKEQLLIAYRAGIQKGLIVEFHSVEPIDKPQVESLVDEFYRRVDEQYQKAYSNSEIYRITSSKK